MVKAFIALFFLFTVSLEAFQDKNQTLSISSEYAAINDVMTQEDLLTEKIKSFVDERTYINNKEFIRVIFDPKSDYYRNERVDSVKVIQTLKENGLLKLFFKKPTELKLNFKTSGSPLFFVKLMGDTLRNIGYYRYVTTASSLDVSEFIWNISLKSEYATDPLILENELNKSGSKIIDVTRISATEWTYIVDISEAYLNVPFIGVDEEFKLKRSLYAHWVNVLEVKSILVKSSRRNSWYPDIAYYDASLHLLKVLKKDKIYRKLNLNIPPNAKYMKISDLYTLKNVRDSLTLIPSASK